jgi:cytidylate kinase
MGGTRNKPDNTIVIAIDGHSSCGKSTIARDLARALDYLYIDTGAMYRAVTLQMIRDNISLDNPAAIETMLQHIQLEFRKINGIRELFLDGENVEKEIRHPRIAALVSPVAEISSIRRKMVELQRKMAEGTNVILEGRDIGTVVFPNADIKFFITADIETRAKRRLLELMEKGTDISLDEVKTNLAERDRIDSTREDSPLRMAKDALLVDTTEHTRESQLALVLELVEARLKYAQDDLELRLTDDGSHTVYSRYFDSPYHSMRGAIRESLHVFIETGLSHYCRKFFPETLHILETGLGTGLNALLALLYARELKVKICYHSLEEYPVGPDIARQLNYPDQLEVPDMYESFMAMHTTPPGQWIDIDPFFRFRWDKADFETFPYPEKTVNIVFFDPFDANTHQEVWQEPYLEKLIRTLKPEGLIVTYGAKGSFRRALKALGMYVESLPGPPGKREITRATKG